MVLRVTPCIWVVFLPPAVRRLKEKNKLFFGREFGRGVRPQKLSRRRESPRHLFKHCAGEVAFVFLVSDGLDLVSQRIGKRDGLPYPVGCSVSRFLLLLHAAKCQTLYDGLPWGQVPITHFPV